MVNGRTWPKLEVQRRRYRFRLLNGCNSRFLILKLSNGLPFWQIGAEGCFLPEPVPVNRLLLGPAERADVIVDFTDVSVDEITLKNLAPDEPFGGGVPVVVDGTFVGAVGASGGSAAQDKDVAAAGAVAVAAALDVARLEAAGAHRQTREDAR